MADVFVDTIAVGLTIRLELLEQLTLWARLLDDGLDDPVAVGEPTEIVGGVADVMSDARSALMNCGGFALSAR